LRFCLVNVSPGSPKELLALALEFFLRGFEFRDARFDFLALPRKAVLSFRRDHFLTPLIRVPRAFDTRD
jgi:hypothetical protein